MTSSSDRSNGRRAGDASVTFNGGSPGPVRDTTELERACALLAAGPTDGSAPVGRAGCAHGEVHAPRRSAPAAAAHEGAAHVYPPHPLFMLEPGISEMRDIVFVSFARRGSDGRIEHCPEEVPAATIRSWDDVARRYGGGEYKAIGKDSSHRIVAWHPPAEAGWVRCNGPSRPFTLSDGTAYPAAHPTRSTFPRLRGVTPEAIALWATLCAEQVECDAEALAVASATLEQANLRGQAIAMRRVAKRILRGLVARSAGLGAAR